MERVEPLNGFANYIGDYIYLCWLARYTYKNNLEGCTKECGSPTW